MKAVGKVVNKSVNAEGHSSVTIQAQVETGDISKPAAATITVSSADESLIDQFKVRETREITL